MFFTYVSFLAVLFVTAFGAGFDYSYDDQDAWDSLPNSQCGGSSQSPINVVTANLDSGRDIGLTGLEFTYLDESMSGTLDDNGHTIQFNPDAAASGRKRILTTYRGQYELQQFHFHWGSRNSEGSEHTVNAEKYSGELHLVHKAYGDTAAARDASSFDYYTVVGVLLEADDDLSADGTLWEAFSNIPGYNDTVTISDSETYGSLLPSNRSYYYYNGSLTTPPCNEIVQWVLLQTPMQVPSSFIAALRTTEEDNGDPLQENFRDVQPLNDRKVYNYDSSSAASALVPTFTLLFLSLLLGAFFY